MRKRRVWECASVWEVALAMHYDQIISSKKQGEGEMKEKSKRKEER